MLSRQRHLRVVTITAVLSVNLPGPRASTQQNDPAAWAEFGVSVAATAETIFVVASPIRNGERAPGAVHIFQHRDSGWDQVDVLAAPEVTIKDPFGISIAADDHTLVVGAQFADARGDDSGLAYVFERRNERWQQAAVLSADEGAAGDEFGNTVSLSGETIVVGARLADIPARDAGAAYIFVRQNGSWKQIRKLTASDPARGDLFGRVSIDNDAMIVSADLNDDLGEQAGKAYAFQNRAGTWIEVAKLMASDGTAGDEFGLSLALKGDTAVFGASGSDALADGSGAAYVFARRNDKWTQTARLTANDGARGQTFGWSVAVGDDLIVVGAPNDPSAGESAGAVYVFERKGSGWRQAGKLIASDAAPFTGFGSTVAISGDRIVVGMLLDGKRRHSGAAYLFERNQNGWAAAARLVPERTTP